MLLGSWKLSYPKYSLQRRFHSEPAGTGTAYCVKDFRAALELLWPEIRRTGSRSHCVPHNAKLIAVTTGNR
jgi:hypothetical protein